MRGAEAAGISGGSGARAGRGGGGGARRADERRADEREVNECARAVDLHRASLSLIKFDMIPLRQLVDELERIEWEF
jgi:hypothetical protein